MQSQQEAQTPSLQPVAVVSDIVPRIRALMVELKMSLAVSSKVQLEISFYLLNIACFSQLSKELQQHWPTK